MKWACAALAVVLLVAVYAGRLDGAYVWDDVFLVETNRTLTDVGGLHRIFATDLWSSVGEGRSQLYHPLPMLTLWLQAHAGLLSVVSGRLVNLALHLACATLLFALLRRLRVALVPSLLLPLVLLAHPSTVEPVMWLTGRHDLLAVVFSLAALLAWPRPNGAASRALVSALCCAAAFLCKEPYVVVPVLLLGLAWVERSRPRLVVPSVVAVLAVIVLRHALGISSGSAQLSAGPAAQLRAYASIVWHYAAQLVSFDVGPTIESYVVLGWLGVVVVLVGIAGVCVLALRSRVAALGALWFVVALAPHVLSLPMIGLWANRYAYFPLLGLLVLAGGATQLVTTDRLTRISLVAVAALVVLGIVRSRAEAATWHDELALYTASVEARPDDGRALYHLGHAVQRERGCAAALPVFVEATKQAPDYVRAWRNVAGCLINVGRPAEAVAPARRAVALSPDEASQRYNLGAALVLAGQKDEGRRELETALRLDPGHAQARALLELAR